MMENTYFAFFGLPGGGEWIFVLIAGILIFGNRLPSIARDLGRSVVQFKKGLKNIETDIDNNSNSPPQLESKEEEAK
ncbi:twin-arginine translocase TatA/TatE family subunit [Planctomycetota bacterium]